MLKVSCIIPSSCSKIILKDLRRSITSLKKSSKLANISIKIFLVVDSSKKTNPLKNVVDYFIKTQNNFGFGAMNNIAIEKSFAVWQADWIMLINDDAWVEATFFNVFKKLVSSGSPDVISPIVYKNKSLEIDSFGIEYFKSGYATPSRSATNTTTLAAATCLLIRSKALIELKRKFGFVFNTLYYYYHEDVDLSIRLVSAGKKIIKSSELVAYHKGHSTSSALGGDRVYLSIRNTIWVIIITWPSWVILKHLLFVLVVNMWLMITGFKLLFLFYFYRMVVETFANIEKLREKRVLTTSAYPDQFNFQSIFSNHVYRTRKNNYPI